MCYITGKKMFGELILFCTHYITGLLVLRIEFARTYAWMVCVLMQGKGSAMSTWQLGLGKETKLKAYI